MDGPCCFGRFKMISFVDMGISAEVLPQPGHLIELKRNMEYLLFPNWVGRTGSQSMPNYQLEQTDLSQKFDQIS
jgi:hypothetical protein